MQYHGVGRHHDQWPHAPTCGCEWTMTGQRYIHGSSTSSCSSFRGAVGDSLFMDDAQHVIENSLFRIVYEQRGYSTSRMASAF
ncbi:hypothetical protein TNCV_4456001, partial [Trichonephila clavipes]